MALKVFTIEELRFYDGQEGRPAYIAYRGKVYDVSTSYSWRNGEHYLVHKAGTDLTNDLQHAPHGTDLLENYPVVGFLENAS